MKTLLQPSHCVSENSPARPARPLPWDPEANLLPGPARDWGPVAEQYRKGDRKFFHLLCCRSTPLVDKISREQYFSATLGREEAYSIAAMSMVNFWSRAILKGDLQITPGRLYHAMRCDLINQINRQKTRRRRELHYETGDATKEGKGKRQEPPADSRDEPEQQALQAEQNRKIRDCLKYLGKKERQVIHGYFFRQLSVTEIAKEMRCSPDCVSSAKRHALKKLRDIFTEKQIRGNS